MKRIVLSFLFLVISSSGMAQSVHSNDSAQTDYGVGDTVIVLLKDTLEYAGILASDIGNDFALNIPEHGVMRFPMKAVLLVRREPSGQFKLGSIPEPSLRRQAAAEYRLQTTAEDSLSLRILQDSLRTHGEYTMFSCGFGGGIQGGDASDLSKAENLDLTIIFGKNLMNLDLTLMEAGSIPVGTPQENLYGTTPAPTVPVENTGIFSASFGQRIGTNAGCMAGLAFVRRTRNTTTTQVTVQPGFLQAGGTYWNYTRANDSYAAVPVSIVWFWRWSNSFGAQLKAQLLLSYAEVSGSLGFSIGFGGFPSGTPQ